MSERAATRLVAAIGLALAILVVGACGDDSGTVSGEVEFGEGTPPPAFPDDFPVPRAAVIGTTLIDPVNHRSEMAMQIDAPLVSAVQYFNVGLVSEGYVVDRSQGTAESWTIAFSRGELSGEVVFQAVGDLTQAVASVNGV